MPEHLVEVTIFRKRGGYLYHSHSFYVEPGEELVINVNTEGGRSEIYGHNILAIDEKGEAKIIHGRQ